MVNFFLKISASLITFFVFFGCIREIKKPDLYGIWDRKHQNHDFSIIFVFFPDSPSWGSPPPQPVDGSRCAGPVARAGPRRHLGTSPSRPGGRAMRRINGGSDSKKNSFFKKSRFFYDFRLLGSAGARDPASRGL